ncbi:amidohydrolase [Tomitella biformata]|uniref:amidohydrolase n=1 Tax=Tomitella biformata TaxID=630403 RepID=UPI0004B9C06F|nr:amidohydrolase [Tomitella biformata]
MIDPSQVSHPDSVYLGGTVRTMTGAVATAFACRDGLFTAVGGDQEIRALAGPDTRIADLAGATVLPGFIETHLHPFLLGMDSAHVDAGSDACPTIAALLEALGARAALSEPGAVVLGTGFDDSLVADDRGLTAADLDQVSTTQPVIVRHLSAHGVYVNSFVLRTAGVDAQTPDPVGGVIVRGPDGAPTGEFREIPAMRLVGGVSAGFPPGGLDDALRIALERMASVGVTSFHDMFVSADMLASYQRVLATGELTLRARTYLGLAVAEGLAEEGPAADTTKLAIGGVKLISDGSLQLHTGALTEPYHDLGGCHCGEMAIPAGDLATMVAACHDAGRQVAIHTNGDRAIDLALDAIEAAATAAGTVIPHRLEHVQTLREDQIHRMLELGVAASVFVNHVYYWGDRHRDRFLGPERGSRISPLASIAAAGLPFALHCDCPVTPVNPLFTIDTAVNRVTRDGHVLGPEQRISPELAVAGYTSSAATITGEQALKGSIEAGKLADFVLLDADPLACEPAAIKDITVLSTVVGDVEVYSA